jgi:hypothetical protein
MRVELKNEKQAKQFVKRMVFLAYNACRPASGLGMLQASRLSDTAPTEEQVWRCAYNQEDYPSRHGASNEVFCDYVFGRMMKWSCKWEGSTVIIHDKKFTPDYQSFCRVYSSNEALVKAALESLGITDAKITHQKGD